MRPLPATDKQSRGDWMRRSDAALGQLHAWKLQVGDLWTVGNMDAIRCAAMTAARFSATQLDAAVDSTFMLNICFREMSLYKGMSEKNMSQHSWRITWFTFSVISIQWRNALAI